MSNSTTNRLGLGNIVQRKGEATRPVDVQQRGELAPPPAAYPPVEKGQAKEPLKALTLRIPVTHWRHLRDYAHQEEASHQQVLEEALKLYFEAKGKPLPVLPHAGKPS